MKSEQLEFRIREIIREVERENERIRHTIYLETFLEGLIGALIFFVAITAFVKGHFSFASGVIGGLIIAFDIWCMNIFLKW